ncbi:MAG: hypothetical protein AB7G75_05215 [Candidatus Binatia bacterium]
MTTEEKLEEFRNRLQEVDLPTLRAFERELHRLLELKKESQLQTEQGATAQEEFRQQYPRLTIDPDLFALVGIQPATPVEEDKTLIREQIFRRLAE